MIRHPRTRKQIPFVPDPEWSAWEDRAFAGELMRAIQRAARRQRQAAEQADTITATLAAGGQPPEVEHELRRTLAARVRVVVWYSTYIRRLALLSPATP